MEEFLYNNNTHKSLGISPLRVNYGFDPVFGGIPVADQCFPLVDQRLKLIANVKKDLKECIKAAQEAMKI